MQHLRSIYRPCAAVTTNKKIKLMFIIFHIFIASDQALWGGDGRKQFTLALPSSGLRGELAFEAKVFFD